MTYIVYPLTFFPQNSFLKYDRFTSETNSLTNLILNFALCMLICSLVIYLNY